MILTVPDTGLEGLLASTVLLTQLWPGVVEEVKVLIQVLLAARPSLAEALSVGLVRMLTPVGGAPAPQVFLAYQSVVLSAFAADKDGDPVAEPYLRPGDVWRLAVADIVVGGRSALSRAAG
jgi:hypothetical protein